MVATTISMDWRSQIFELVSMIFKKRVAAFQWYELRPTIGHAALKFTDERLYVKQAVDHIYSRSGTRNLYTSSFLGKLKILGIFLI